jgi:hypothetical protein
MVRIARGRSAPGLLLVVALAACVSSPPERPRGPSEAAVAFDPATTAPASTTTVTSPVVQLVPEPAQAAPEAAARFFNSPSELRDELAVHEIAPRLYAGLEGEAQWGYEKQDPPIQRHGYLDSATAALRWVPVYGLVGAFEGSYDLHTGDGLSIDEATMTLGAMPAEPWYVTAGYTELPFGEYNSHFREDPVTQVLGEMQGNEVQGGYETDLFETTIAAGRGHAGSESTIWVANVTGSPVPDMDVGAYWTNDVRDSVEVRNLINEHQSDSGSPTPDSAAVPAAGTFMALEKQRYAVDLEYITALGSFAPGVLSDSAQRPWAYDFEASFRPTPPWEVGARFERSGGLPGSPVLQYGVETQYSIGPHAAVSLEYLHGIFSNGDADRDLITAGLLLRW